jgi:hypothetical protein
MKHEFSRKFFKKKASNIKLHENRSSGNRGDSCERMDRQMDVTKLVVVFFLNYSNAINENAFYFLRGPL